MFNQIQIYGLLLNLIVYIAMILPIILISFKKSVFTSKKTFITFTIISIIIETFLSIILYNFSRNIYSIFTSKTGIINYAVHASKIIFISSSLYSLKILFPAYIFKKAHKKAAILVLSKITVNIVFILIGYNIFNTKGILYSFPICDIIYYLIYFIFFLKVFR